MSSSSPPLLILAMVLIITASTCIGAPPGTVKRDIADYGRLPILFEPNVGQAPREQLFVARGMGYAVALSDQAVIFSLRTNHGTQAVTLAWSAVSGATSYNIYQGSVPGDEGSAPTQTVYGGTTEIVTGLSSGSLYYYEITAVNVDGESAKSSEVSAEPTATVTASGGGGGSTGLGLLCTLALGLVTRPWVRRNG